jgi:hypothetical protein
LQTIRRFEESPIALELRQALILDGIRLSAERAIVTYERLTATTERASVRQGTDQFGFERIAAALAGTEAPETRGAGEGRSE